MKVVWLTVDKYREDGFNKIGIQLNEDWESCVKLMANIQYVASCLKEDSFCTNVRPNNKMDAHVSIVVKEPDVHQIVRLRRIDTGEIYDEHIYNVIPLSDLLGHTLLNMVNICDKSTTVRKHYALVNNQLNSLSEFFHSRMRELRQ